MAFIFYTILFSYVLIGFILALAFCIIHDNMDSSLEDKEIVLIAIGLSIIYPLFIPKYLVMSIKTANSYFKDSNE